MYALETFSVRLCKKRLFVLDELFLKRSRVPFNVGRKNRLVEQSLQPVVASVLTYWLTSISVPPFQFI